MLSSRRGWYCSAARSTVAAGRRTTCSDGTRPRLGVQGTRARQHEWAGRPRACAARSARGLFLSTPTESMVSRVALGGPPASLPPPALGTCPHAPLSTSPPTTLRTADRSGVRARSRERGALMQRHLADPRRREGLRARVCYAREDRGRSRAWLSDGCARWDRPSAPAALARGPLELDPPRLDSAWTPFAFGSVSPARVRALRADLSFVCPHSAPRGQDEQRHERRWFCPPVWHAARCTLCTLVAVAVCVCA